MTPGTSPGTPPGNYFRARGDFSPEAHSHRLWVSLLYSLLLAGCATSQPIALNDPPPAASAAELLARYNANAVKLDRVWSTPSTFLRWRDADTGKMRREVGDGIFIFRRPSDIALTVGKLGNVMIWAGGNAEQFWLFDLQNDDVVYVGSYDQLDPSQTLPMPVRPDEIPVLLGMMPMDPTTVETTWHEGDLLVERMDGGVRLLLDGESGLVKRVDLTDAEGYSQIICELVNQKLVKDKEAEKADWSVMPAEAHVRVVGEEGSMVLKLANLTRDPKKFRDKAFDFEALMKMHKPKRVIDLDEE